LLAACTEEVEESEEAEEVTVERPASSVASSGEADRTGAPDGEEAHRRIPTLYRSTGFFGFFEEGGGPSWRAPGTEEAKGNCTHVYDSKRIRAHRAAKILSCTLVTLDS
jgi:hypothetical protein